MSSDVTAMSAAPHLAGLLSAHGPDRQEELRRMQGDSSPEGSPTGRPRHGRRASPEPVAPATYVVYHGGGAAPAPAAAAAATFQSSRATGRPGAPPGPPRGGGAPPGGSGHRLRVQEGAGGGRPGDPLRKSSVLLARDAEAGGAPSAAAARARAPGAAAGRRRPPPGPGGGAAHRAPHQHANLRGPPGPAQSLVRRPYATSEQLGLAGSNPAALQDAEDGARRRPAAVDLADVRQQARAQQAVGADGELPGGDLGGLLEEAHRGGDGAGDALLGALETQLAGIGREMAGGPPALTEGLRRGQEALGRELAGAGAGAGAPGGLPEEWTREGSDSGQSAAEREVRGKVAAAARQARRFRVAASHVDDARRATMGLGRRRLSIHAERRHKSPGGGPAGPAGAGTGAAARGRAREAAGRGGSPGRPGARAPGDGLEDALRRIERGDVPAEVRERAASGRRGGAAPPPEAAGGGGGGGDDSPPGLRKWGQLRARVEASVQASRERSAKAGVAGAARAARARARGEEPPAAGGLGDTLRDSLAGASDLRKSHAQLISEAKVEFYLKERDGNAGAARRGPAGAGEAKDGPRPASGGAPSRRRTPTPELHTNEELYGQKLSWKQSKVLQLGLLRAPEGGVRVSAHEADGPIAALPDHEYTRWQQVDLPPWDGGAPSTPAAREAQRSRPRTREARELQAHLISLSELLLSARGDLEQHRRAVLRARTHPLMEEGDVEVPESVRIARQLIAKLSRRTKVQAANPETLGAALGEAILGIPADSRQALVAGLVLLEEVALLRYLQDSYTAQRQGIEQRRAHRALDRLHRRVDAEERRHVLDR